MFFIPDEDKLKTYIRRKSSGYSALEERILLKPETQILKKDIPEIKFEDLKINHSTIDAKHYLELKNIYTQIINSQNSHIVLKKKA